MGNLNEFHKNGNKFPHADLEDQFRQNDIQQTHNFPQNIKNPEKNSKNRNGQGVINSMTSNRFFQTFFQNNKNNETTPRKENPKEAILFSNLFLELYSLDKSNICGVIPSILINEDFDRRKNNITRVSTRMTLLDKNIQKKMQQNNIKEFISELKNSEFELCVELFEKSHKKTAKIETLKPFNLKNEFLKESIKAENESEENKNTKISQNRRNSLQVLKGIDKKSNPSYSKIDKNLLNLLQSKKMLLKSKKSDDNTSLFAKFMKTTQENPIDKTIKEKVFEEKSKSKIASDLKSVEFFKKKIKEQPITKCDDLSSKRLSENSNSTAKKTAEFTVVPNTTFSFQNNELENRLESESSLKNPEQMNLEKFIRQASVKSKSKRDSFYRENSRLSINDEKNEEKPKNYCDQKNKNQILNNDAFIIPKNSHLELKNKRFLEQILEVGELSQIRDSILNRSKSYDNCKKSDRDGSINKSNKKSNKSDKIKEIARSNSSKITYHQVIKSDNRKNQVDNSLILSNITQKYSFFKPKNEIGLINPKSKRPSQRSKSDLSFIYKTLGANNVPQTTTFDYNGNHISTSVLSKIKKNENSVFDSDKCSDTYFESTNQSSKETNSKKDSSMYINVKNIPSNIKFNMENCFKKK